VHDEANHDHEQGNSGDGDGKHQNTTLSTFELCGDVNIVFFPQRRGSRPGRHLLHGAGCVEGRQQIRGG
jgi:hypothetical protein